MVALVITAVGASSRLQSAARKAAPTSSGATLQHRGVVGPLHPGHLALGQLEDLVEVTQEMAGRLLATGLSSAEPGRRVGLPRRRRARSGPRRGSDGSADVGLQPLHPLAGDRQAAPGWRRPAAGAGGRRDEGAAPRLSRPAASSTATAAE